MYTHTQSLQVFIEYTLFDIDNIINFRLQKRHIKHQDDMQRYKTQHVQIYSSILETLGIYCIAASRELHCMGNKYRKRHKTR